MHGRRRSRLAALLLLLVALSLVLTSAAPALAQSVGPNGQGPPGRLKDARHRPQQVKRGPITPDRAVSSDKEERETKGKDKKSKELKPAKDVPDVSSVRDVKDK